MEKAAARAGKMARKNKMLFPLKRWIHDLLSAGGILAQQYLSRLSSVVVSVFWRFESLLPADPDAGVLLIVI